MDQKLYIEKCKQTESTDNSVIISRILENDQSPKFYDLSETVIQYAQLMDEFKKLYFYGKEKEIEFLNFNKNVPVNINEKTVRLLHAAIGFVTESAEFLEKINHHIYSGEKLDEVNLVEEIGDLLWYSSIALDSLKSDFSNAMDKNIAKLSKRYPDLKFTEDKALNRDLGLERKTLEGSV